MDGGKTPEPNAAVTSAVESETRRSHPEPDPIRGNPNPVAPTDEQKTTVTRLNIEATREALEKRLESKQRQREDCIDGSAAADVLDEEVEKLEKQFATEIRRLQEDCEEKKEKLRASFRA